MDRNIVYGFLAGLYAGRFTNMFSNMVITGLTLYFYQPEFYTYTTFDKFREAGIVLIKSIGK